MSRFSHIDGNGKARMVDVGDKSITRRSATATVTVYLNKSAFSKIQKNEIAKGDVLTVAQLAGIQAAKKTSEMIPLCHQVPLDNLEIRFDLDNAANTIAITAIARATATTGVEMEALSACSVAALTIYDMVKAIQKDIVIDDLMLLQKTGGKSGDYRREDS